MRPQGTQFLAHVATLFEYTTFGPSEVIVGLSGMYVFVCVTCACAYVNVLCTRGRERAVTWLHVCERKSVCVSVRTDTSKTPTLIPTPCPVRVHARMYM